LESFRVEPDIDSLPDHTLVEFVDSFPVAVCVDEKNTCSLFRSFHSP
jgi:hypothetical protein